MKKLASAALFVVVACAEAAPQQPAPAPQAAGASAGTQARTFDAVSGERAFDDLKQLVGFGPRPAGSAANQRTRAYIAREMEAIGLKATEQSFTAKTPFGPISMSNVIVTLPGKRSDRIIIGSHFDTKPERGFVFVGANDGGSSTALLIELARVLRDKPGEFTYELVFFDGEEAFVDWHTNNDNTYGSRHYVDAAKQAGTLAGVKAMILLDMIGERNVEIRQDTSSTRWLNDIFWQTAGKLGHQRTFVADTTSVDDDHMSFIEAGVPAIDLIDLEYPHWHQATDTLDKVDPKSLKIVGDVVVAALPEVEQRLASGR